MTDQRWCCNGNAEDCRLCTDPNPPYPFLCPGHDDTPENRALAVAQPVAADVRERIAHALATLTVGHKAYITVDVKAEYPRVDAVLAELKPELERLADYEHRITWGTTCQSCARVLDSGVQERERLEQETRRLGDMVDEYGRGASALTRKLKQVRDMHRETCPFAKGELRPTAFTCGMCELLDTPATELRRMADEAQQERPCPKCGDDLNAIDEDDYGYVGADRSRPYCSIDCAIDVVRAEAQQTDPLAVHRVSDDVLDGIARETKPGEGR